MKAGDIVSRYVIEAPIGKGGMGEVFRALDTRLGRTVALKFLPPESLEGTGPLRFLQEARAAAAIRHPNICPVYDLEEADGRVFIAMAFLEGETLAARIKRGPVRIGDALDIVIQAAAGLSAAHAAGVVHRDIKCSNIMVGSDGHVAIMDFGLALSGDAARLTADLGTMGTPAYMSPEQAQGLPVDRRTDIWSLGVVLFEALTGTRPFRREQPAAILHAIVNDPVPTLGGVPEQLQKAVARALAKKPADRWQSVAAFADALREMRVAPTSDTVTLVPAANPGRVSRRGAAIAAVIAVAAGGIGYAGWRLWPHREPWPGADAGGLPAEKQVAVVPFRVIGNAEATGAVSDGMVEVLTAALSDSERYHGRITAVPASEVRRRNIGSAAEARRVYGVNLAITGSAQPAGSKTEFTLSLVDTVKMRQIASRTFVYDPDDPLASRDRAVDLTMKMLSFDVTAAERDALSAGDSGAPEAYSAYVEGRGLLARYDQAGNVEKAIAAFGRATRRDPNFALAYAGLAEAYWRRTLSTGDKNYSALAIENAERGVRLNGDLAPAHTVLGQVYGTAGRDADAIRELRRALDLAPTNAEALRQLAELSKRIGRFDEAESLYLRSTKARPTDWYGYLLVGLFYLERQRYPECEAAFRKAQELTPGNDLPARNLGSLFIETGRYREAIDQLRAALRMQPNALAWGSLGLAYYYEHRFGDAASALEAAIDLDPNRYWIWGNLGMCYRHLPGGEAKAVAALKRAIEIGGKFLESAPRNYDVRADMAEYRARLGDEPGAMREVAAIPRAARERAAFRIALAMELTGHRDLAVQAVVENVTAAASLSQVRDDPDLEGVWKDPRIQAIRRSR